MVDQRRRNRATSLNKSKRSVPNCPESESPSSSRNLPESVRFGTFRSLASLPHSRSFGTIRTAICQRTSQPVVLNRVYTVRGVDLPSALCPETDKLFWPRCGRANLRPPPPVHQLRTNCETKFNLPDEIK